MKLIIELKKQPYDVDTCITAINKIKDNPDKKNDLRKLKLLLVKMRIFNKKQNFIYNRYIKFLSKDSDIEREKNKITYQKKDDLFIKTVHGTAEECKIWESKCLTNFINNKKNKKMFDNSFITATCKLKQ